MSHYSIIYKTKAGGSEVITSISIDYIAEKARELREQKLEARIYRDGKMVRRVWEMNCSENKNGWNFILNG